MQIIIKKALQELKNYKNILAKKVTTIKTTETTEKEEYYLIIVELLVSKVRYLIDYSITLVILASYSAIALEAF